MTKQTDAASTLPTTSTPRYPEGTPEYEAYAAALREELDLFATRQPPYDQVATSTPAQQRAAAKFVGFGR